MNHPRVTCPQQFAEVLADPGHDAPRLRLAEALRLHGDPVADFILRVLCQTRGTQPPSWVRTETQEEFKQLWERLKPPRVKWFGCDRGLVAEVGMTAEDYRHHLDEVLAHAPVVSVSVTELDGSVDCIVSQPLTRRIRALYLSGGKLDDEQVKRLAACDALLGLRFLALDHNRIGEPGIEALVASPHLTNLRYVNLDTNPTLSPVTTWVHAGYGHPEGDIYPQSNNGLLRQALERTYGPRPWLEPPSEWFVPGRVTALRLCDDEPFRVND